MESFKPLQAGFFLWLKVGNGEKFTYSLWKKYGIRCLPGSYLTHQTKNCLPSDNPGSDFIRVALVHPIEKTALGLAKIAKALNLITAKEIESHVSS